MQRLPDEFLQVITKTIIPALVAVSVGLAVKMKKSKITITEALLSIVIGVGFAAIMGPVIHEEFSPTWASAVIAAVAITSEKVGYWLVFQFDFTRIGNALIEMVEYFITKKR